MIYDVLEQLLNGDWWSDHFLAFCLIAGGLLFALVILWATLKPA